MNARSTIVRGDPAAVDAGIAHVRDHTWPTLQGMSGCIGVSMIVERAPGRCIVTAAWASDEAMRASAEPVKELRRQVAEALRAHSVEVAEWEIAVLHRLRASGEGAGVRVLWADVPASGIPGVVDTFRMVQLDKLEEMPGFCGASLLVDRSAGRVVFANTFASRDELLASRERTAGLVADFARSTHMTPTEAAEFELAIAHLRVPELA